MKIVLIAIGIFFANAHSENKELENKSSIKKYLAMDSIEMIRIIPTEMNAISPIYPDWALDYGVEGKVVVAVSIDTLGNVICMDIITSAGNDFDSSATKALKKSKYIPYEKNGIKLPAKFLRTFNYEISVKSPRFAYPEPEIGYEKTFPNGKKGHWNGETWIGF